MFDFLKPKEPESPMIEKPARTGIGFDLMREGYKAEKARKTQNSAASQTTATTSGQTAREKKFADIRANADKRTWETETKPKDQFLEGFNYYSEKKEEPKKVTMEMRPVNTFLQPLAVRNKYADSKVMEKPKDDFLEGFYYYDEEKPQPVKNDFQTRLDGLSEKVDLISAFQFPVDYGPYKYVDRNDVYSKIAGENSKSVRKPTGQFGVALKSSPTVAMKNGKAEANYVFGLDTKYTDAKGNLQPLEIPQWHFDRDAIKSHNSQRIDSIADTLASHVNLERKAEIYGKAAETKAKQALKVDEIAKTWEGRLNSADALSKRSKANRAIANAVDEMPKILDSGVMKTLKTGGKAMSVAGDVLNVASVGMTIYSDYKDDGKLGKDSVKATAGFVGDVGGSVLGAKIGAAALGALGGVFSGGVLAAPLAAVGGILGGIIGGYFGGDAAEELVELMY